MWTAERRYECSVTSARDARSFCTEQLHDHFGSTGDVNEVVDSAQLIVSEMITNAVNAECSTTDLRLSCEGDSLRISVHDDGDGLPQVMRASDRDEHGRGLAIIDALAATWGIVRHKGNGKQVWAELTIPAALAALAG
jgi:anti-sigma regulatory factor (Ser/Thr protein kinase)